MAKAMVCTKIELFKGNLADILSMHNWKAVH